jgi:MFS family permease
VTVVGSGLRGLPGTLRLLIGTQLCFNVGFYAVLPYLSVHLTGGLGLAGWLAGLILGLRTFSQQGLFVVGGALTDRFGPRPIVLIGCGLRVLGFAGLGLATETWAVIASTLLVGFAAALFSPAVESEVARQAVAYEESGVSRTRVLGLFSVAGQIGALTGPVLGVLLLSVGFRASCFAGAAIFVLILGAQYVLMPSGRPDPGPVRSASGMHLVARNRPFLALSLGYGAYLLGYNQLYQALPVEVQRATGSQSALGWLFVASSLLVVACQLPISRWASAHLTHRRGTACGLLLISAGFTVVAAAAPLQWTGVVGLLPASAMVVLLTFGQMLIVPAARAWVPDLAEDGRLGLYTGALSSIAGLTVLAGSALTGFLLDGPPSLAWLVLAALPAAAAAILPRTRPEAVTVPVDGSRSGKTATR